MMNPAPQPLTAETETDRLQRQLEDAWADLQRHARAQSKLQNEFMASRLEVASVHASLRAAQAHIDELRVHAANREAEIARLHAAYAALENILNNIRASRLWQISAPIRAAARLLRRSRGKRDRPA